MKTEDKESPIVELTTDERLEYQETLQSLRHYSTLRFAMLTVFSGASAGLAVVSFGSSVLATDAVALRLAFRILGLVTICTSFWLELILNGYMNTFGGTARRLRPNGHWARRHEERRFGDTKGRLPPLPLTLLHAVIAALWLLSIQQAICALWSG